MAHRIFQRSVALGLVGTTILLCSNLPTLAGSLGSVEGRVMAGAKGEPRGGVVVMLVDETAQKTYRSSATDARGAFRIEGASPGTYQLLVDAPEGAFLAAKDLSVASGPNRPVALTLQGRAEGDTAAPRPAPSTGLAPWQKWVIVGGIAIGALLVVDAVTEEEDSASSF